MSKIKKLLIAFFLVFLASSASADISGVLTSPRGARDYFPGYLTNNWYAMGPFNSATNAVGLVAGRLYAQPIVVWERATFSSIGLRTVTGQATSEMKAALYDSSGTGGRPGNRLANINVGVATTSSSADIVFSISGNITLDPGVYWLAHVGTTSGSMPTCQSGSTVSVFSSLLGTSALTGALGTAASINGFVYTDITYASGPPATFGAATELGVTSGCNMALRAA